MKMYEFVSTSGKYQSYFVLANSTKEAKKFVKEQYGNNINFKEYIVIKNDVGEVAVS